MPFIDNLISAISPQWSAKRRAWRTIENSYKGGVGTRLSESWRMSQGYRFGTSSDRMEVATMRDRAYQAYRDNAVARTLVQTETDNVIGDGLNFQPTSDNEAWNKEAKDRYYEWIERASVRGGDIHTGCDLQRLLWSRSRVAGDIGWILVKGQNEPKFGIDSRVQIIAAENIATPDGRYTDPNLYDGIQYNSLGRPVTFYVREHEERSAARRFAAIEARDFVYLSHMTEPDQARGVTCFETIFDRLSELDRYIGGVALAAWMATVIGIIFKQTNASQQLAALPLMTNSQGEQQRAITFEKGMVKYIGTDDEVAQVQAHQPMSQTPEFIRAMFRTLGQPFDMPLEVIAKDMSTCTFASARIGLLPFYRSCRIKAARFATHWSRTINWWLQRESLRPDGDPKKWKTKFPDRFWSHELLPNAWDYTDPVSEVQGDMLQIDAGFKSPQMVISERGRDAAQILREREEWIKITKEIPQYHSSMSQPNDLKSPQQPGAQDEQEEPQEDSAAGNGDGRMVRNQPAGGGQ